MKRILLFACIACVSLVIVSCAKKDESVEDSSNEITIYGNVIDRVTGQPLFNVLIQEKNKVGGSTVTGNDGNYEFTLPLNGTSDGYYYLTASKDKYSTSEYELNMNDVDKNRRIKVDFQLTKESITYAGTVVDSKNKPIFDVHISAQYSKESGDGTSYNIGTTTMTDANGAYKFELPSPGGLTQWKYAITATKNGYASTKHVLNQNVDDMGKNITLNFIMKTNKEQEDEDKLQEKAKQVTVYGRVKKVVNLTLSPLIDAQVSVYYYSNFNMSYYVGTVTTDSYGDYSISFVPPISGTYFFNASKSGYSSQTQKMNISPSDAGKYYKLDFNSIIPK